MNRRTGSRPGTVRTLPIWSAVLSIAVAACGEEAPTPAGPAEPDTVVSSIAIFLSGSGLEADTEQTIGVLGGQLQVRAEALAEDGTLLYRDFDRFAWSSSAPDIATVDEGTCRPNDRRCRLVTGLSEGTGTITATSEGVTADMTVTIRDAARHTWSVPMDQGWVTAGITIGPDGMIYAMNSQYGTTSRLFALSSEGNVVWSLVTPFRVRATPAIGDDGTLYLGSSVGGEGGRLFAVDPGGMVRWELSDIERIRSSPAIGPDGTIYVAGGEHVYAVDPQGEIQWTYERESDETLFFVSSPGVASDGTIYVGGEDGLLYALNPDGSLQWTFRTGDRIRSSPSIGADGTIYVGSHDGRLYAIHPDGTERWSVELDFRGVSSAPSIGPDGTIYVIAGDVFAVDPEGSVRWSYPARTGGSRVTPLLGADGTVYITSLPHGPGRSAVKALDTQGRLLWEYATERRRGGSPAIGIDGTIIAASVGGSSAETYESTVHAITETDPTNGGFEGAPWPTERGDRANTGRAGR